MRTTASPIICGFMMLILCSGAGAQDPCLDAWYKFNDNVLDWTGNGNHATNYGATFTTDRFGTPHSAAHFDGSDYIDCPDDFDFPERTICMWIRPESYPTVAVVYAVDHNDLQYGLTKFDVLNIGSVNNILMGVGYDNEYYYDYANPDKWYHLAMSITPSQIRFFLNGELVDSLVNDSYYHSNDGVSFARMGANRTGIAFYTGDLDEVIIYDCALTDEQIEGVYASLPEDNENSSRIVIGPNPVKDVLKLEITDHDFQEGTIRIMDFSGRVLKEMLMTGYSVEMDVSGLKQGAYLLQYRSGTKVYTKRFVRS